MAKQVYYVSKDGSDSGTGAENDPFLSIGRALQASQSSNPSRPHAVRVGPGEYPEGNLVIPQSTSLVGTNGRRATTIRTELPQLLHPRGRDILISGFTLGGSPSTTLIAKNDPTRTRVTACAFESAQVGVAGQSGEVFLFDTAVNGTFRHVLYSQGGTIVTQNLNTEIDAIRAETFGHVLNERGKITLISDTVISERLDSGLVADSGGIVEIINSVVSGPRVAADARRTGRVILFGSRLSGSQCDIRAETTNAQISAISTVFENDRLCLPPGFVIDGSNGTAVEYRVSTDEAIAAGSPNESFIGFFSNAPTRPQSISVYINGVRIAQNGWSITGGVNLTMVDSVNKYSLEPGDTVAATYEHI